MIAYRSLNLCEQSDLCLQNLTKDAKQMDRTICCDNTEGNRVSLSLAIVPLISLFTIIMICSANINGNGK